MTGTKILLLSSAGLIGATQVLVESTEVWLQGGLVITMLGLAYAAGGWGATAKKRLAALEEARSDERRSRERLSQTLARITSRLDRLVTILETDGIIDGGRFPPREGG